MKITAITLAFFSTISLFATEQQDALTYINQLRNGVGLTAFHPVSTLDTAAQNHAKYLLSNTVFGHYEVDGNPDFTGVAPENRGNYAGYSHSYYSENISAGDSDINASIDGLFTAIYHRLKFLDFNAHDLGVGYFYDDNYPYKSAHVFNMATNSATNTAEIAAQNPLIVKWPYEKYQKAQPAFLNNEFPAPLPECAENGPSGNPVSIQFNTTDDVVGTSFTLRDQDGNILKSKVLDSNNNDILTSKEYVLFPIDRLDWDSTYTATFDYTIQGDEKSTTWSFKTRALKYPILKLPSTETTYNVSQNSIYAFFEVPTDCNDSNGISYGHRGGFTFLSVVDANTYYVQVNGAVGSDYTATIRGKQFSFHVFTQEVSDLTFDEVTSTELTLNWKHNTGGEDGFKIYRNDQLIATIDNSQTTYHDSGLSPLTTYKYTVKAYSAN
jgi:uncharacterized protein YkwD